MSIHSAPQWWRWRIAEALVQDKEFMIREYSMILSSAADPRIDSARAAPREASTLNLVNVDPDFGFPLTISNVILVSELRVASL